MPLWVWAAEALAAVVGLLLVYLVALVLRRRWLARHGGTFELSLRRPDGPQGRGWVLGVGRYGGDRLEFFRVFSVLPRASLVLRRDELAYDGQRDTAPAEDQSLYVGHVVVAVRVAGADPRGLELAMAPGAVTGFLAWLEAGAPPRGWS